MRTVTLGLAGMGTVGGGVFKHLVQNRDLLRERLGVEFDIRRVAVRDLSKQREVDVPADMLTTNPQDLIDDPEIEIIVELMGGVDLAYDFVVKALETGKTVVTGNKALIAERGEEIFRLATEKKAPVFFEAAVAGGIPIIKSLREAFVGNHILSMQGILNGTSNYILTRMSEEGLDFAEVLEDAKAKGYAEADPTLDINGWDAAHKAIILASLAYGFWVGSEHIHVEGIEEVTAADIRFASELGYCIKHLAMIKADADGMIDVRLHPTLIPKSHVLASVNGVFNAVAVRGDIVGDSLFYGRGAGMDPTTSSVISDLAEAAIAIDSPRPFYGFTPHGLYKACKPISEVVSQFYLRLSVADTPGVLADVARVLADHGIGISSVIQPESHDVDTVPLVLMVHDARNDQMDKAVAIIEALDCIKTTPTRFRVDTLQS